MSYPNEVVVTVEIYDGLNRKYCRHIRFKLTPERIIEAIEKINSILSWQVKRAHIKPLIIPEPEDGGIAPEWLIRELTFRDDYKGIRVDKKVLEAIFTELREKGLLKYEIELVAEGKENREKEESSVAPLIVPRPSEEDWLEGYTVIPKWVVDKIVAENKAVSDHISRKTMIALFAAMWKSGLLKYADSEGD